MCFRGIVESEEFSSQAHAIASDAKRLDRVLFATTWALSRHPEHFPKVPGTRTLHRVLTDPFPDMPILRIWYSFNEQQVMLHSIEFADEGTADEGQT